MTFEDMLNSQLEFVKQAFSDFEVLKRVWMRESGIPNDFSEYRDHDDDTAPVLASPFEEDQCLVSPSEEDEPVEEKTWNRLTAPWEYEYGHREIAPPRMFTDYSMIDENDPDFARGIQLGLPTYVSLHVPHAGQIFSGYGREE